MSRYKISREDRNRLRLSLQEAKQECLDETPSLTEEMIRDNAELHDIRTQRRKEIRAMKSENRSAKNNGYYARRELIKEDLGQEVEVATEHFFTQGEMVTTRSGVMALVLSCEDRVLAWHDAKTPAKIDKNYWVNILFGGQIEKVSAKSIRHVSEE